MSDRVDWKVLKSFGHAENISKEWLSEVVRDSQVEGRIAIGRPCRGVGWSQKDWYTGTEGCESEVCG